MRFTRRARLHRVVVEDDGEFEHRAFPDVEAARRIWGRKSIARFRPAYLRFTSGTTNRRKGVILGHDAILERLKAANRGLEIVTPADRILWLLPMAHHFVVSILLYLEERRHDPAALELHSREKCSSLRAQESPD